MVALKSNYNEKHANNIYPTIHFIGTAVHKEVEEHFIILLLRQ